MKKRIFMLAVPLILANSPAQAVDCEKDKTDPKCKSTPSSSHSFFSGWFARPVISESKSSLSSHTTPKNVSRGGFGSAGRAISSGAGE